MRLTIDSSPHRRGEGATTIASSLLFSSRRPIMAGAENKDRFAPVMYNVNSMFPELSRRRPSHDKSASRMDLEGPKALTGAFSSNDDANWWMITRSGLTVSRRFWSPGMSIHKKDIKLSTAIRGDPCIAQEPKPSVAPNQSKRVPDEWKVFQEEMQRFVGEIGLDKEIFIESAPNEMVISLKDTVRSIG